MNWNPRVVADSSGAEYAQGAQMPCDECHLGHGAVTSNSYQFDGSRYGSPVRQVRQLCEGCHRPADSVAATQTVLGLVLRGLPAGVDDHYTMSSRSCIDCHGSTGHSPFEHGSGADCGDPACHGATGSHAIHLSSSDPRGPASDCWDCHLGGDFPYFDGGEDSDASGHIELDETTACDTCHSPGGDYDGVDSTTSVSGVLSIGAKDHWSTGVYETTSTLKVGKEKWCAGCHDKSPSIISGVSAPNAIGDEGETSGYGPWGYYRSGHGRPLGVLPGSEAPAPDMECGACHDASYGHIDGDARTYASASDNYQTGYRLADVEGGVPMVIPRYGGQSVAQFALCFKCHDSDRYLSNANRTSNFGPLGSWSGHAYHLRDAGGLAEKWDSDWDYPASARESYISCPTCHNVHGTPTPIMARYGHLISTPGTADKVPGFNFSYLTTQGVDYPTLAQSSGGRRGVPNAHASFCAGCHGTNNYIDYSRTPNDLYAPRFQGAYGAAGSPTVVVSFSEGVYTVPGASGALVPADFALTDTDDGRTVVGVTHTAGDAIAHLTLSSALDGSDDVGVDLLSAATTASIYDAAGNGMTTATMTVSGDATPPIVSHLDPAVGEGELYPDEELLLTLEDAGIGVDWETFQIQLSGSRGYSETYTDLDSSVVTVTGTPASYRVEVDPDVVFAIDETITVTVSVDDLAGNSATPPAWWFTTSDAILEVPAEYSTIQSAIDAALEGWTVRAADGTYSENITFRGKAVTVASQNGAASTMIEGTTANQPVVLFESGETTTSVLEGFTIDNAGYSTSTRGIRIGSSRPTIRDCVIKGNQLTSSRHGAGFYIDGTGGAVIEDCVIGGDPAAPNEGMNGVAIYWVSSTGVQDDLTIRRTIISHNNGANGALLGGWSTAGALTVEESTITANTMTDYGGGVYLNGVSAPARFTDTYIGDNSASRHGGGAYLANSSTVFSGCDITSNTATLDGGGLRITGASAATTITGGTISENTGSSGGGFCFDNSSGRLRIDGTAITGNVASVNLGGGVYLNGVSAPARFTDTYIGDNSATRHGGGAYLTNSSAVFSGCDITSNTATLDGGGLRITGASAATTITGSTISENTGRSGGGFYLDHSSGTLRIDGTAITGNVASVSHGGAMRLAYVTNPPLVTNTSIEGNQAAGSGGGAYISNGSALTLDDCALDGNTALGWGGGAYAASASTLSIVDCTIDGNRAGSGNDDGGGLYVTDSRLDILRTYIRGNRTARNGGGLLVRASSEATLTNCTISGNAANGGSGSRGGGIYSSSTTTTITNCTISGNYASQMGGGIYNDSTTFVRNCIVYGNEDVSGPDEIAGTPTVEYSDVRGGFAGTGNIDAAPSYVATVAPSAAPTTTGDYHLVLGSPCEGVADSTVAPADDIDGGTRPQGSGDDMGSDEIGAVAAAKGGPVTMTLDDPVVEGADPHDLPTLPSGIEGAPHDESPAGQPFFTTGEGFVLVGSYARDEVAGVSKGYLGSRAAAPLGMPASTPLAVGLVSFAALAWRAAQDLLGSLR